MAGAVTQIAVRAELVEARGRGTPFDKLRANGGRK